MAKATGIIGASRVFNRNSRGSGLDALPPENGRLRGLQ
jgi:hypothetical protein